MTTKSARAAPTPEVVRERMRTLPRRFRQDSANGLVARCELRIGEQAFTLAIGNHQCAVEEGPSGAPATVITADPALWLAIDEGSLTGGQAFLEQRLVVTGNLDLAMRLQTLFRPYRRARRASELDQVEIAADKGLLRAAHQRGVFTGAVVAFGGRRRGRINAIRRWRRRPAMGRRPHCSGASKASKQTRHRRTGMARGASTNRRRSICRNATLPVVPVNRSA